MSPSEDTPEADGASSLDRVIEAALPFLAAPIQTSADTESNSSTAQNSPVLSPKELQAEPKPLTSPTPIPITTTLRRDSEDLPSVFDDSDDSVVTIVHAPDPNTGNATAPAGAHCDLPLRPQNGGLHRAIPRMPPGFVVGRKPPQRPSLPDRPRQILRDQFRGPPAVGDPNNTRTSRCWDTYPPPSEDAYPPEWHKLYQPPRETRFQPINIQSALNGYTTATSQIVDFVKRQGKRCEESFRVVREKDAQLRELKKNMEECISAQTQILEERLTAGQLRGPFRPRVDLMRRCVPMSNGQTIQRLEEELLGDVQTALVDRAVFEGTIAGAAATNQDEFHDKHVAPEQIALLRETGLLVSPHRDKVKDIWDTAVDLKMAECRKDNHIFTENIRGATSSAFKEAYMRQWAPKDVVRYKTERGIREVPPKKDPEPEDPLREWAALFKDKINTGRCASGHIVSQTV